MPERALPTCIAALLLAAAGAATAAPPVRPAPAACTIAFGQGRNEADAGGPNWDALNARFNAQVVSTFEGAGRHVYPVVASVSEINPAAISQRLLGMAQELGCATLAETAVFADIEAQTLVARLRVYPILPALLADAGVIGLRIGTPLFTTQRDLSWSASVVERFRPDLLGAQMAGEYLQRDQR
jgi:hypothetical protein